MSDIKIPPTQENGKPWEKPSPFQRFLILALPKEHPYRVCELEWLKLTMSGSVGMTAQGMAELSLFPPFMSTSGKPPLRIPTFMLGQILGVGPSDEQKAEMEQGFVDRKTEDMLNRAEWLEMCAPAYDFNSYYYRKH
jgi:hypothetical protein